MEMPSFKSVPFAYAVVFGLGLAVALGIQGARNRLAPCLRTYDLLNLTRRCSDALVQGEWNFEPLRDMLSAKKEAWKSSGTLTHVSVYFQDLDHGPRFGIGEYDKFHPASLMKLPILIFFLHAADLDPHILEKTLSFTGKLDIEDNVISPEETIQPDTPHTIREMLTKMIVYSDNRSYMMLLHEMNALAEDKAYLTFRDLDVLQMMVESENAYVSISSYAKLYSVLYNTGYLSKEMSQFALRLLSEVMFRQGIAAGVPEGLRVAHKFGYTGVGGVSQLHDCGIVYHPKMAYILCIMTSGPDQNAENEVIREISRTVYDTISGLDFNRPSKENVATL